MYAMINGVEFDTLDEFAQMLVDLVTEALDCETRGAYTEFGMVYHFMDDHNLIPEQ